MPGPEQQTSARGFAEKVEQLPRYDGNGFAKLGESVIIQCANGRYVLLQDVRALVATEVA